MLEWIAATGLRLPHRIQPGDLHRIDDLRAEGAQVAERAAKHVVDFAVEGRRVVRLAQHAEARAVQTVAPGATRRNAPTT